MYRAHMIGSRRNKKIRATNPRALQSLFEQIAFGCTKSCQSDCECKKIGINSSVFCREYEHHSCKHRCFKYCRRKYPGDIDEEVDVDFMIQ